MRERIILLVVIIWMVLPVSVLANSMEPPGIVIIVEGDKDELEVWLEYGDSIEYGNPKEWPLEVQFWFNSYNKNYLDEEIKLHVKWGKSERTYLLKALKAYHNTFTVRVDSTELIEGKSVVRSVTLVGMRVVLTLVMEGLIFYIMGFREKRSWIIFLAINIITQSMLNIYINTMDVAISYPIIILVMAEFWVFIAEGIGFPILLQEKTKGQRILYVLIANSISLIAGGYLLTWLPV